MSCLVCKRWGRVSASEGFWGRLFEVRCRPLGFSDKDGLMASIKLSSLLCRGIWSSPTWRRLADETSVLVPFDGVEHNAVLKPRQGSSMAILKEKDRGGAVLYGGWTTQGIFNDIWILGDHLEWKLVGILRPHVSTYGHVLTKGPESDTSSVFYVSGGVTRGGYGGATNQLVRFEIPHDVMWKSPQETYSDVIRFSVLRQPFTTDGSNAGSRRAYHSVEYIFDRLLLYFGGFDEDGVIADLELYDIESDTFSKPSVLTSGPDARFGHTSVVVSKNNETTSILYCGGTNAPNNMKHRFGNDVEYEDMYLLTIHSADLTCTWDTITFESPNGVSFQRCHSSTMLGHPNSILVFGGGLPGTNSCAMLSLNVEEKSAVMRDTLTTLSPSSRQNHSAVWLKDDCVLVFGGASGTQEPQEELGDTFIFTITV